MHFEGWKESFDEFGNGGEKRYWTVGGAFGWVFVRFWDGDGYCIFPYLRDVIGLDAVVDEFGESKDGNGAQVFQMEG